jgi:hypothetical protein
MKSATSYYKSSYLSNLSKSLNSLVRDGRFNEPSAGKYALTAKSIEELRRLID